MASAWDWETNTRPFSTLDGEQPARFKLHQVDDDKFVLLASFAFTSANGRVIPVTPGLLGRTDLASIPSFLGWFARRHGRHTPAALLHDQLVTEEPDDLPEELQMPRAQADLLFREALLASGVGLVKSWVLWTGVTLGTRRQSSSGRVAIVAWFVAAVAGSIMLGLGWASHRPLLVAAALLAPVPFAALWGEYKAGLVAGYAFWLVVFGSGPAWLAYQVYRGIEYLAVFVGRLRPRVAEQAEVPQSFDKR